MNDNTKRQMQQAKALIQQKRYDDARAILITVDHPKADVWLQRLNSIAPQEQPSQQKSKSDTGRSNQAIKIALLVAGLVIIGLFAVFMVMDNQIVEQRVDAVIEAREDANHQCRLDGKVGVGHTECVEIRMAEFRCKDSVVSEQEACLAREMPTPLFTDEQMATMQARSTEIHQTSTNQSGRQDAPQATWTYTPSP